MLLSQGFNLDCLSGGKRCMTVGADVEGRVAAEEGLRFCCLSASQRDLKNNK